MNAPSSSNLPTQSQTTKGIALIILSAFFFALMGLFVNLSGDLPVVQKSFFRNAIAALFALAFLLRHRISWHVGKGNRLNLFLRASFGTLGLLCNFYALSHLQLSDASMLSKVAPFSTLLFSVVILKERIKFWQLGLVAGAFVGMLFVIKPSFSNAHLGASLVGFAGGICAGIAYTLLRKCQQGGVNGQFIVFFFSVFSSLVVLPLAILHYQPMTVGQSLALVATGLCAAGGQFAITAAYRCAPAREISIYDYSTVFFSMIFGLIVFQTFPDAWSLLGYAIVLTVAILNFRWTRKNLLAGQR